MYIIDISNWDQWTGLVNGSGNKLKKSIFRENVAPLERKIGTKEIYFIWRWNAMV